MSQVTLISMYGDKDVPLARLITACQRLVSEESGDAFEPYDLGQIHATIVGLERRIPSLADNANFVTHRGRSVRMNFQGFLAHLRGCDHLPFDVQIGGFQNRDYPFRSRNALPYERSFSVQGDKVMLTGWPVQGEPLQAAPHTVAARAQEARLYPATLEHIRCAAQEFGILHAYHRALTDRDNDLFFRIGLLHERPHSLCALHSLEARVRQYLSDCDPLITSIGPGETSIAAYVDERLPLHSTRAWPISDPGVTAEFVATLYD